jgi:hypothetical protein
MPPLSLSDFVAALQFGDANECRILDPLTGQIVHRAAENQEPLPPDGNERLPTLTDQEELAFARQFTAEVANPEDRRRLALALASGDAHAAFETTVFRCQIANAWFQYRDRCLVQFAKDWLDARNLSYTDDVPGAAD